MHNGVAMQMTEPCKGFADQILSWRQGCNIAIELWPELAQQGYRTCTNNMKFRNAFALAEFSPGALDEDELEARCPRLDVRAFLSNPENSELVDAISQREEIKDLALQKQARRALKACLDSIASKLQSPDVSLAQAQSSGDTAVKIQNLVDRQPIKSQIRELSFLIGTATVTTPEGSYSLRIEGPNDIAQLIIWMRCSDETEVDTVLAAAKEHAPRFLHGGIRLGSW